MQTNQAALDLIKSFEGWRANAYPDPATNGEPWTIGYGHTTAAGPPTVSRGLSITLADGEAILKRDLRAVEQTVAGLVHVPLTSNQFGALVSFTFNLGGANLKKSTLLKKVNAKDFTGAAAEFAKWNKAAGKTMAGLTRRRAAEAKLFLTPATWVPMETPMPSPTPPPPDIEPIPPMPAPSPLRVELTPAGWAMVAALLAIIVAAIYLITR